MDSRRVDLRDRVLALRGYVGPFQEAMIRLDPDWTERYLAYVCAPNDAGRISMRLTQLIYVAIDAVCSHLYPQGIGRHAELAVRNGATPEEVVEARKILSDQGLILIVVSEQAKSGRHALEEVRYFGF